MKRTILILGLFLNVAVYCQDQIKLDLEHYPFSHYGSYMSIMYKNAPGEDTKSLFIRDISGRRLWQWKGIFKIEPLLKGQSIDFKASANPFELTISTQYGNAAICFEDNNILKVKGEKIGLRLTQYVKDGSSQSFPINIKNDQWRIQMGGYDNYVFTTLAGKLKGNPAKTVTLKPIPDRPQLILTIEPDENGIWEFAFEQYQDAWVRKSYNKTYKECKKESKSHFDNFSKKLLDAPDEYAELNELAKYVKWSSVVAKKDLIKRDAYYCSKNTMNAIWPWDNCFSALASCKTDMQWAIDQILVIFDHQTQTGALPSLVTDQHIMWGAYKPPVQGLMMQKILELSQDQLTQEQLEELYFPIARFTRFWFNYLDDDQDGVPQYNHANDSGQDNGTAFEAGYPTESPDLSAYLIKQLDFLAEIAAKLGKTHEARQWQNKSQNLLKHLTTELWTGEKFVAKNSITNEYDEQSHSFTRYIPLILGDKLPKNIKAKLIDQLKAKNSILTPYGPASEHPDSPYFYEDSYWRGAIWAPQWFFLVEGLKRCGEEAWAKELAKVYCDLCKKNGFPENFSALNGGPLKDSAYSWTTDVFLIFAYEYLNE